MRRRTASGGGDGGCVNNKMMRDWRGLKLLFEIDISIPNFSYALPISNMLSLSHGKKKKKCSEIYSNA